LRAGRAKPPDAWRITNQAMGLSELLAFLSDSKQIITEGGLLLVTLIVFAETGLFFAFFLPGDYLLFTAGLFCGTGFFEYHILVLLGCLMAAAVGGNFVGYTFGRAVGKAFLERRDSFFYKKKYLEEAHKAFEKYGDKALIAARFLPIVRTFAPILAGIVNMTPRIFYLYNVIGAVMWVGIICGLGYVIGRVGGEQTIAWLPVFIGGFLLITTSTLVIGALRIRAGNRRAKASQEALSAPPLPEQPQA
jgi:membrane-associated protein